MKIESVSKKGNIKRNIKGWSIMAPGIILFAFFVWIPLCYSIVMSLCDTVGFQIGAFHGLASYREVFSDPRFIYAFKNTFKYLGWSILIGFIIPIIIGLLLSETVHLKGLFRIGIYIPAAIAGITISILFSFFFDPSSGGFLNTLLVKLGKEPIEWLDNPKLSIPLIVITMTWRGAGSTALIYLSAFQAINTEYYEAARIDGANTWNRITKITLPNIIPNMTLLFVLQVISVMQVIFEPMIMTNGGGPNYSSLSLLLLGYQYAFSESRSDMSAAVTVILASVIGVLTIIYYSVIRIIKKKGYNV